MAEGAGRALVLVHGFMGSAENFRTWMAELPQLRRVIIPDLPGCGLTPPLPAHSVAAYAAWLRAFTEKLGLARMDLGGLCLGATVALEYARRWPASVDALLLHTPICSPGIIRPLFQRQAALFTSAPLFGIIHRLSRNRRVSDLYKRYLLEGPDVDPEDARLNFENQVRAHGPGARDWLRDALRQDYEGMMARWPKPALILAAEDDRIVQLARLRQLAAGMPRATLTVIPAAGHGWNVALIAAQVRAVRDFLRAVAA